jgi:hypothetical protein
LGWRWRLFRWFFRCGRSGGLLLGGGLALQLVHDRDFLLTPQKGEANRSQHKNNRDRRREFGQKRSCPSAAEDRLAGAPKSRTDSCPLAVLQEYDGNQGNTYYHMDDDNNRSHDPTNINKGFGVRKPFSLLPTQSDFGCQWMKPAPQA